LGFGELCEKPLSQWKPTLSLLFKAKESSGDVYENNPIDFAWASANIVKSYFLG
jgi:hypothetical protein